jgi:DNA-binding phage protein
MLILTSDYLKGRLVAPGVNLRAVAKEAGLNEKTLYRIRDGLNSPSLDTAELVLSALDKLYPLVAPDAKAARQPQRKSEKV